MKGGMPLDQKQIILRELYINPALVTYWSADADNDAAPPPPPVLDKSKDLTPVTTP